MKINMQIYTTYTYTIKTIIFYYQAFALEKGVKTTFGKLIEQ